jgi:hypothetical protein
VEFHGLSPQEGLHSVAGRVLHPLRLAEGTFQGVFERRPLGAIGDLRRP